MKCLLLHVNQENNNYVHVYSKLVFEFLRLRCRCTDFRNKTLNIHRTTKCAV